MPYYENDNMVGRLWIFQDTTEHRMSEEQTDQLEKLFTLNKSIRRIIHELNNYLAGISGYSELLAREELSDKAQTYVSRIIKSTDLCVSVVNSLLTAVSKVGTK
jgi:nitrogen-specific signal transduction histidine kinase